MKHVTVTEAKAKFSELLTAVERGETVSITRHGKVIACLQPDESSRQARIDLAIAQMRELRKRNEPVSADEIIAWKNEGRP